MTTLHCHRFAHYMVYDLFACQRDRLLKCLYERQTEDRVHVFYLVVLLAVIYFKTVDFEVCEKIEKLLATIQSLCKNKQQFHELYVYKNKKNFMCFNEHTHIPMSAFNLGSHFEVQAEFESLKGVIRRARNTEWLPSEKTFRTLKSLCNFAYRYNTSNRLLRESEVDIQQSELAYPKAWLDFAYFFKKKLIDVPSSRRRHYQILLNVLADPIRTNNLSFSQYVNDQLDFMNNFIDNKVININPPGCYCHAKCVGKQGSLEKLYTVGLFVLCKTCNRPVNYNHRLFRSVSIMNDPNNSTNYFACSDSCSEFEIVDLHECSLNDDGTIYFRMKALLNVTRKQKFVTSICLKNRTCLNIVTEPASGNLYCEANHDNCHETCFANLKFMVREQKSIDRKLIEQELCVGCLAFCFDVCTRRNPVKTLVRSILGDDDRDVCP